MKTKVNYEAITLEAINNSRRPLNIADIKRKLGVTRVTAHRHANRLADKGLVHLNKTDHSHWYSKLEVKA